MSYSNSVQLQFIYVLTQQAEVKLQKQHKTTYNIHT